MLKNDEWSISGARTHNIVGKKNYKKKYYYYYCCYYLGSDPFNMLQLSLSLLHRSRVVKNVRQLENLLKRPSPSETLKTLKRPHGHYKGHRGMEQKPTCASHQDL